jgi:mono/diheme cytochrome c family protein
VRQLLAYVVAYAIAAVLLGASLFFAWVRSQQYLVQTEAEVMRRFDGVAAIAEFDWQEMGAVGYQANCEICHGSEGQGRDAYPPLVYAGRIFTSPGGRDFLLDVTLYGLASPRHSAPMPPLYNIQDAEVAAINNHVLSRWGNERWVAAEDLYLPGDVAARRGQGLRPHEVDARWPAGFE